MNFIVYSCNLRRVPFDTSQWLTGLPCLNKIDLTWLEPDFKKLHRSWVFIKICLLLNFLTNNIVTGKCNCSNVHLWIQPSLQFFDNKTNLTCSRLSGCHATLSGERCVTSRKTAAKETSWNDWEVRKISGWHTGLFMGSWYSYVSDSDIARLILLLTPNYFFAKMNLCTRSKRIAAIFSFF